MNTTELPVRPDVSTFVARVRGLLADLPEEERLELTEGLEADLADEVAEQGRGVLADPESYAHELRAAAGLGPVAPRRRPDRRTMGLDEVLDDWRAGWFRAMSHPKVAPGWSVVVALRPAWWVMRAWVAAVVLARLVPGWYDLGLTWLPGVHETLGLAMFVSCVVLSTLVGLRRLWPGTRPPGARGEVARGVLVALNLGAVCGVPLLSSHLDTLGQARFDRGFVSAARSAANEPGITNAGRDVCNIAAYDAQGHPLVGVQLFDQAGRPLDVRCWDQQATKVPWVLDDVTRWNVFPLGERDRPARTPARRDGVGDAAFPTPDRATTPPVTHPLLPPVVAEAGRDEADDGRRSSREEATGERRG